MAFVGFGQNDSGGQAEPSINSPAQWSTVTGFPTGILFTAQRGPLNTGVLYQLGGSVFTGGYGQIFPTGRS